MWNAYWALPDTMDGAVFLGSIPLVAVKQNQQLKADFVEMTKAVVSTLVPSATWPDPYKPAPEHERGGNA